MKEDAVLIGPCVGEFFWELFRFSPMLSFYRQKKYKNKNVKFIILTREERFDLYGKYANILVPLQIPGDFVNKWGNCFRLMGLPGKSYHHIIKMFRKKYGKRYNIIEHIYPSINKSVFCNKNQIMCQE